jgi:hypothetical protein
VLGSPVYFGYQSNIVGFLKKLILKISWRNHRFYNPQKTCDISSYTESSLTTHFLLKLRLD